LIVILAADAEVLATTIELTLSTVPLDAALFATEVSLVVLKAVELVLP
jgi:hypothetical protein